MWLFAFGGGDGWRWRGGVSFFPPSLYIFMFNSYFIFYNRGNFSQESRHSALGYHRDTALNPVTLSFGGREAVSHEALNSHPTSPLLSPAGLLASTSSPHEISNFLHSSRSHIVAIFFSDLHFSPQQRRLSEKKNTKKKHEQPTASDPQKTIYLSPRLLPSAKTAVPFLRN